MARLKALLTGNFVLAGLIDRFTSKRNNWLLIDKMYLETTIGGW